MTAFALDENHDLYLGEGGSLARVVDADFVVQSIRTRLLFYLAEWWLDLADGTAWFQRVFVKPANIHEIERLLKRRILETRHVQGLVSFSLTYKAGLRDLVIQFEALTDFGPSGVVEVSTGV